MVAQPEEEAKPTVYERLGGDDVAPYIAVSFCDEWMEHPDMKPFFKGVSKSFLSGHMVKLFRTVFASKENQPDPAEFLQYLLASHARLFREMGLNETHFDPTLECCRQALVSFSVDPDLVDEIIDGFRGAKVIFEYGAKVAEQEKLMTPEERETLPKASAATIGTDTRVVLPEWQGFQEPSWLIPTLKEGGTADTLRSWTGELMDLFSEDLKVADTVMHVSYMDGHGYATAFLSLAFFPEDVSDEPFFTKALSTVKYPCGPGTTPLSLKLFDRMIIAFHRVCEIQGMKGYKTEGAMKKLEALCPSFGKHSSKKAGGHNTPHYISPLKEKRVELELSMVKENEKSGKADSFDGDDTIAETSSKHSTQPSVTSKKSRSSKVSTKEEPSKLTKLKRGFWGRVFGSSIAKAA